MNKWLWVVFSYRTRAEPPRVGEIRIFLLAFVFTVTTLALMSDSAGLGSHSSHPAPNPAVGIVDSVSSQLKPLPLDSWTCASTITSSIQVEKWISHRKYVVKCEIGPYLCDLFCIILFDFWTPEQKPDASKFLHVKRHYMYLCSCNLELVVFQNFTLFLVLLIFKCFKNNMRHQHCYLDV